MNKFNLILPFIVVCLILVQLYAIGHHGKLIVKEDSNIYLGILWIALLIFWSIILINNVREHEYNYSLNIMSNILWIGISIFNIIRSFFCVGIRENGVYNSNNFYKWSKIQGYSWISENTIQFKINTFFKTNKTFELTIKKELKPQVIELLQRQIDLYSQKSN